MVESSNDPARLVRLADGASGQRAAELYLQAAIAYERSTLLADSDATSALIQPAWLSESARTDYELLIARQLLRDDNVLAAQPFLDSALQRILRGASAEQRRALDDTLIEYDRARGDTRSAAERLLGRGDASPEQAWQLVSRVHPKDMLGAQRAAKTTVAQQWWSLSLALANAISSDDARSQYAAWRADAPAHPAALNPPAALQDLLRARTPGTIAVLLPLSGRLQNAGNAVRDGMVGAYLANQARLTGSSGSAPRLLFYDTAEDDVVTLANQAVAAGAEVLVGPLSKANARLVRDARLPVPVLLLNYLDPAEAEQALATPSLTEEPAVTAADPASLPTPAFEAGASSDPAPTLQLALAVEDQASSIAAKLRDDGHSRVALLHSESSWAQRAAATLQSSWANEPDGVLETRSASTVQELTEKVGELMRIDASEARHAQLARALGLEVEFQARARGDLDAIVALVDGRQARALRPALRFHFAGELPVYASSQAMRGLKTDELASLRGFQLVQTPWELGTSSLAQELPASLGVRSTALIELQGLGVDALRLAAQLDWLSRWPHSINGSTGALIPKQEQMRRQLSWALMSADGLVAMPEVAR